ncbi:hypothetical protein QTI51_09690 [Variovorax sp. J22G73]|uniref:hypothetical protein n=1 Tax=unclassified Variovorax TaxID=663243 RepID=UPI002576EEC3|nr:MULTISPECIES: hypothetical protein [unclassified Variovorax]MDM0006428.1 hypothetical protein [Variovorax sp. J22R203]MDM0097549.1 hypothetical protein [Variovorax sp. J22G73]
MSLSPKAQAQAAWEAAALAERSHTAHVNEVHPGEYLEAQEAALVHGIDVAHLEPEYLVLE